MNHFNKGNYAINNRNLQLLISEEYAEKIVPSNDSVRLLDEIIEEMRLEPLERANKRTGRNFSTNLRTMLKIVVYGAMELKTSSREIEKSCKRDINFIWLLNGEKVPNYATICRFRRDILSECSEEIFYELVQKLNEYGEIKYEHLFVDGTKIEANANKYSFVWKKSTNKYEVRVKEKLEKLIPELKEKYNINENNEFELYIKLKKKHTSPFVHGRGTRKSQLQRDIEELDGLLIRKVKYEGYQDKFDGRNSFSKTDEDATFMRMKEDHMKNG